MTLPAPFRSGKPRLTHLTSRTRAMKSNLSTKLSVCTALLLAGALAGCGVGTTAKIVEPPVTVATGVQGIFMGGQQPVGNINIQLYQTGTSYGGAATPLFSSGSVKTTPSGNFNLASFSCTSGSYLYIVGTGGNPIAGQPVNPNLALMSALGLCDNFNPGNFINVNELTSVAAVYSLSGFMTGISNIGAPSSNATGLRNAFAAVTKIVNTSNGQLAVPGGGGLTTLPANATLPSTLINTLGDIMEQCINSAGGSASDSSTGLNGTPCGNLFKLTPNSAGTYPTDTITAMLNLAQHPTVNVAQLNDLRSASPAFQPALSVNSPPAAFNIGIVYTGGGLSNPQAIAVDSSGNVWAANKGNNSVTEFDNSGAAKTGATGYAAGTAPAGIAIDLSGNAWVTNSTVNTITKVTPSGTATAYSGNGLSTPQGIAIDSNNQIWVANTGNGTASAFTNAGGTVTGSPFSGGGLANPVAVATSAK